MSKPEELPQVKTVARIEVGIHPFTVPNFVRPEKRAGWRQDGIQFEDGIPLAELPEDTLSQLCDDFRRGVFERAGKKDPRA